MSRKVAQAAAPEQAKGIQKTAEVPGFQSTTSPQDFRPFPTAAQEAGESLARALRVSKAEAIGERLGLSRSRVYELAADPSQIPVGLLLDMARLDPDPVTLERIAHSLLVASASLAAERKRAREIAVRFSPAEQGRLFE